MLSATGVQSIDPGAVPRLAGRLRHPRVPARRREVGHPDDDVAAAGVVNATELVQETSVDR
jgi:hypothetical protein